MEIKISNFTAKLLENEITYFKHLEGVISSVDNFASLSINKRLEGISVRILPSDYQCLLKIMKEIKHLHTQLGLKVEFSKSIKTSNHISFIIDF